MKILLFKMLVYSSIGIFIEVVFTAITNFLNIIFHTLLEWFRDRKQSIKELMKKHITKEELKLKGYSYLWMLPCYALLLTFVYEPVYDLIINYSIVYRFIIWGLLFSFFEYCWGYVCWKLSGNAPWQYTSGIPIPKDKGWTALYLIPLWSFVGLFLEWYSCILRQIFN